MKTFQELRSLFRETDGIAVSPSPLGTMIVALDAASDLISTQFESLPGSEFGKSLGMVQDAIKTAEQQIVLHTSTTGLSFAQRQTLLELVLPRIKMGLRKLGTVSHADRAGIVDALQQQIGQAQAMLQGLGTATS